jgi:hypothetical protein
MTVISSKLALVSSWATKVMNASSQYFVNCPAVCASYWKCDQRLCSSSEHMAVQIVGPADCYPAYGDCTRTFEPSTKNGGSVGGGREWIEVQMGEIPLFVSAVEVFETISVGSVVRIAVAAERRGADTSWTTVYSGAPGLQLPAAARVFSPSICEFAALQALYCVGAGYPGVSSGPRDGLGFTRGLRAFPWRVSLRCGWLGVRFVCQ